MSVHMMSPPAPAITVRCGGWQRTFAAGHDVVVGREIHADVRIAHPAISRSHVVLRYLDGGWVAIDDNSFNGMFVANQRVQSVEIDDQRTIHLGALDGPPLTFELGTAPPADFAFYTEVVENHLGFLTRLQAISDTCASWNGVDPVRIMTRDGYRVPDEPKVR